MSDDVKQVKVDNWGIYFLQRLKHFFNRTDYCDLTLQFQDNAQLKVHRLVLSACTEYFELLERTCEMYEDCLVMPDDLQADVVVPIVNFMYTGQLEFKMDLLESLYQTSQIMNMSVLTKLLDAHRSQQSPKQFVNYSMTKRNYTKSNDATRVKQTYASVANNSTTNKRPYQKAFGPVTPVPSKEKRTNVRTEKSVKLVADPLSSPKTFSIRKSQLSEPRPTRYELPEELDTDNIFDDSFSSISYGSQPLMIHPEATKHYPAKRSGLFSEASSSTKPGRTLDIVECKKVRNDNIFDDDLVTGSPDEPDLFSGGHFGIKEEPNKSSSQMFDQILEQPGGPKVTIETKDSNQANNIDHAKIISEVLKKYPHLVKSNKNIKLKILDTPSTKTFPAAKSNKAQPKRAQQIAPSRVMDKPKLNESDFTYESEVMDSKEAARLISMGAENVKGPWICLICGTPGKALHFTSYYKFRRHLVEVHNEKPVVKMCEYCGLKSLKRNYLLHHLYTKHGVEPPPAYHFPKCNQCDYIALTEGFLVKHKMSHELTKNFRCNVCPAAYCTSAQLLLHIQTTGHKYSAEKKINLQCVYCLKVFLRESNLYSHLKTHHKTSAIADGIIDESDEEEKIDSKVGVKYELEDDNGENQYQIQQRPDGNIHLIPKKQASAVTPTKQKILNTGLNTTPRKQVQTPTPKPEIEHGMTITAQRKASEEIVVIDNNEYIMRDNQLIPRKKIAVNEDYIISDMLQEEDLASLDYPEMQAMEESVEQHKLVVKKAPSANKPIQFVVSNEEEYKALMNSNHSIIFNDGDSNKTLTVLSAPHSADINPTTIDMENSHSNDMMIIQDNYPLNVSEALPGNNSNIVVVYSHVPDQNKQYQLISSQDIGAQFVQTSAVISQNYETITRSTPVINAHVIDGQVETTWPSVMENSIIPTQQGEMTVAQIQQMTVVNEAIATPVESAPGLNELPEVTLTPHIPEVALPEKQIEHIGSGLTQLQNINNTIGNEESIEQVVEEEEIHNTTAMSVDIQLEEISENIDPGNENAEQNAQMEIHASNIDVQQQESEFCIVEQDVEGSVDQAEKDNEEDGIVEKVCEDEQTHSTTESVLIETAVTNTEVPSVDPESKSESNSTKEVLQEQIQTLASEWSEDDDEAANTEPQSNVQEEILNDTTNTQPQEIEETIENIQQEMAKQITESGGSDGEIQENISVPENSSHNLQEECENNATKPAKEKISSLLNDWEDSQEDGDSANTNEENNSVIASPEENAVTDNDDTIAASNDATTGDNGFGESIQGDDGKPEKPKDEKIKSLVSDWDDEDEETKA